MSILGNMIQHFGITRANTALPKPNFINGFQVEGVDYSTQDGSVVTGITAHAGGGQASATALTGGFNNVTVCATAGDSVKLLTAAKAVTQIVKNSGATALDVFPNTSDSINALAANLAVRIAPGGILTFRAISSTVWETEEIVILPAPSTNKGGIIIKASDSSGNFFNTITNASLTASRTLTIPENGSDGTFILHNAVNALARIGLGVETGVKFDIPLHLFVNGSFSSFQAIAMEGGSGGLVVETDAANSSTVTSVLIFPFRLPECYIPGEPITISLMVKAPVAGGAVAGAAYDIDCIARLVNSTDGTTGGADLCTTNAIALTSSYANALFTITPTGIDPGEVLKITITMRVQDTGGFDIKGYILDPCILLSVKG